jgi:hypothetical protein
MLSWLIDGEVCHGGNAWQPGSDEQEKKKSESQCPFPGPPTPYDLTSFHEGLPPTGSATFQ